MQHTHEQVRQLFDRIAHRYDLLNRVLSVGTDQYWRKRVIASCRSIRQPRVLDVATGTGDLLLAARSLSPVRLTGLDLSRAMLDRARTKLEGISCLLVEGVAESLPFRNASFDIVLVAFGVRNFSRRRDGLAEIRRVLDRSGQVRILDFSRPGGRFRTVYLPYLQRILPRIGGFVSGSRAAYDYLPDTVMGFPSQHEFVQELERAGFTDIRWTRLTFGIVTLYEASAP